MPYVAESIIVQQNEKLVGLVYPDFDDAFAHGLTTADIERVRQGVEGYFEFEKVATSLPMEI